MELSSPAWLAVRAIFEPSLPDHCKPESDFLFRLSSTLHTCIPTSLAFVSCLLGALSIVSWLFAQLPQIYKNYSLKSTSGLSIFFLGEWLLGDLSNLLGSLFTDQALWQVIIACYYCFVDCCLVAQWIWYERLRHGRPLMRVWGTASGSSSCGGDGAAAMSEIIDGVFVADNGTGNAPQSERKEVLRVPSCSPPSPPSTKEEEEEEHPDACNNPRLVARNGGSAAPSPRTVVFASMLLATVAQAYPLTSPSPALPIIITATRRQVASAETGTQVAGRLLSWLSTLMYLGSRMPQLYKNYKRKSTSGLSPTLFLAAFMGNLFYSSSILANPCAWGTYPPHGAGGWVGPRGSQQADWVGRATPFWLGAAGVLLMDGAVGVQFWHYGEASPADSTVLVSEAGGRRWRWRKVTGWLRGWIPSVDASAGSSKGSLSLQTAEEQHLLATGGEVRYGGVV